MTLTTHIIAAGALAKPFIGTIPPWGIFLIALFSHYLLDAIPHWDYGLRMLEKQKGMSDTLRPARSHALFSDIRNVSIDIALGGIMFFLFSGGAMTFSGLFTLASITLGAILPDALQPCYWIFRCFPFTYTQRFHTFMHARFSISGFPYSIPAQLLIIIFSLWFLTF